jgi:hypothetical protein
MSVVECGADEAVDVLFRRDTILSMHSFWADEQLGYSIACQTHPRDKTCFALESELDNGKSTGITTSSSAHLASTANSEEDAVIVVKVALTRLANVLAG